MDPMTVEQILAAEEASRREFEATTMTGTVTEPDGTLRLVSIAELRAAFDSVCDPENWKGEFTRLIAGSQMQVMTLAIEYFHGAAPKHLLTFSDGSVCLHSRGYAG